jgi:hypothetical protein
MAKVVITLDKVDSSVIEALKQGGTKEDAQALVGIFGKVACGAAEVEMSVEVEQPKVVEPKPVVHVHVEDPQELEDHPVHHAKKSVKKK